jgi:hypothetical protein
MLPLPCLIVICEKPASSIAASSASIRPASASQPA